MHKFSECRQFFKDVLPEVDNLCVTDSTDIINQRSVTTALTIDTISFTLMVGKISHK